MNRLRPMNIPCLVCLLFLTSSISGDVELPAIIGDNMMLQQKIGVPVWGWADPGENVTVSGSWGKEASATAGKDGRWQVNLLTPSFGGPHSLSIQGNNKITINNVIIGEVWLCAGQSNMGWRLSSVDHGKEDAAKANYPKIRIFDSERAHHHEPKNDVISKWTECTPETAASCSAVSFYFAHKLHTSRATTCASARWSSPSPTLVPCASSRSRRRADPGPPTRGSGTTHTSSRSAIRARCSAPVPNSASPLMARLASRWTSFSQVNPIPP